MKNKAETIWSWHLKPGQTHTHKKSSEIALNNFVENKFYLVPFIHFFKKKCTFIQFAFPVYVWICSRIAINMKAKGAFDINSDTLYFDCKAPKVTNFLIITWKEMFLVFLLQFTHVSVSHREKETDLQQRTVKPMANNNFK